MTKSLIKKHTTDLRPITPNNACIFQGSSSPSLSFYQSHHTAKGQVKLFVSKIPLVPTTNVPFQLIRCSTVKLGHIETKSLFHWHKKNTYIFFENLLLISPRFDFCDFTLVCSASSDVVAVPIYNQQISSLVTSPFYICTIP